MPFCFENKLIWIGCKTLLNQSPFCLYFCVGGLHGPETTNTLQTIIIIIIIIAYSFQNCNSKLHVNHDMLLFAHSCLSQAQTFGQQLDVLSTCCYLCSPYIRSKMSKIRLKNIVIGGSLAVCMESEWIKCCLLWCKQILNTTSTNYG